MRETESPTEARAVSARERTAIGGVCVAAISPNKLCQHSSPFDSSFRWMRYVVNNVELVDVDLERRV